MSVYKNMNMIKPDRRNRFVWNVSEVKQLIC